MIEYLINPRRVINWIRIIITQSIVLEENQTGIPNWTKNRKRTNVTRRRERERERVFFRK